MGSNRRGSDITEQLPRLDRPVFIVGPPRSGTTLLWVTLCRHPELEVATETHLLDMWIPRHPGVGRGERAAFEDFWEEYTATKGFSYLGIEPSLVTTRLERWRRYDTFAVMTALLDATAEIHGVARVGEKTPDHAQHIDELLGMFPDGRVLFLLRDPRSTVASELRLDREWAADSPAVAAERWRRNVLHAERWEADPRVHLVRFEDLVVDPAPVLREVCRHLEVADDIDLLAGGTGNESYRHGQHDPWAPMDSRSVNDWQSALSEADLEEITRICGDLAARIGYQEVAVSIPSRRKLSVLVGRMVRSVQAARSEGRK